MTPDDYNARELAAGRITASHITELTRFYQARMRIEPVDGMLGPKTRERCLPGGKPLTEKPETMLTGMHEPPMRCPACDVAVSAEDMLKHQAERCPGRPAPHPRSKWIDACQVWRMGMAKTRRDARTWAKTGGLSEVQLAELRKGMVRGMWADEKPHTNWCAAAVASWLEVAGIPVPRKGAPRRGAQALTRWVAEHGQWIFSPQHIARLHGLTAEDASMIKPGDVICWRRPPLGWRGHVALIIDVFNSVMDDGSIKIAEGNTDGGQLVVRTLGPDEWPTRLSGLYGVARPNYGGAR